MNKYLTEEDNRILRDMYVFHRELKAREGRTSLTENLKLNPFVAIGTVTGSGIAARTDEDTPSVGFVKVKHLEFSTGPASNDRVVVETDTESIGIEQLTYSLRESAVDAGEQVFVYRLSNGHWILGPEGGESTGASIMHYTIDSCDEDYYYVTATYWTGGCGDPPGKDEYTGLWTVEKLPCSSPWTVDDIEAGDVHGIAAYTYPVGGAYCLPVWREVSSCGPMTC